MEIKMERLTDILSYKRRHGSKTLDQFVNAIFVNVDYVTHTDGTQPLALVVKIGDSDETMFSCHLDTVHRTEGLQAVVVDLGVGLVMTDKDATECLGADDGAGVWLLLEMIDANVPGTYCFHYGEECGGIGSTGMARHHADFLATFKRAIAFDRRGTWCVITHQAGGRCCSDKFALALAIAFNDTGLLMAPDDGGSFTDTANYTGIIPECTNVSIGYWNEHCNEEYLDFEYLFKLRSACIALDWDSLPTNRNPKEEPDDEYYKFCRFDRYPDVDSLSEYRYQDLLEWVSVTHSAAVTDALYEALGRLAEYEGMGPANEIEWHNDASYANM